MEIISMEQLEGFKEAIEDAKKDDTPYIGIKNDELHVLGDPNKTEIKSADYVVSFAFPNNQEWRARATANGDAIGSTTADGRLFRADRLYKDVYLSPRRVGAVISLLAQIESMLFQITENGELKELTSEQMMSILNTMNGEMSDICYEIVASVLRIPPEEVEWMLPMNTMLNAVKIAKNNPSSVNEADLFFAYEPNSL